MGLTANMCPRVISLKQPCLRRSRTWLTNLESSAGLWKTWQSGVACLCGPIVLEGPFCSMFEGLKLTNNFSSCFWEIFRPWFWRIWQGTAVVSMVGPSGLLFCPRALVAIGWGTFMVGVVLCAWIVLMILCSWDWDSSHFLIELDICLSLTYCGVSQSKSKCFSREVSINIVGRCLCWCFSSVNAAVWYKLVSFFTWASTQVLRGVFGGRFGICSPEFITRQLVCSSLLISPLCRYSCIPGKPAYSDHQCHCRRNNPWNSTVESHQGVWQVGHLYLYWRLAAH